MLYAVTPLLFLFRCFQYYMYLIRITCLAFYPACLVNPCSVLKLTTVFLLNVARTICTWRVLIARGACRLQEMHVHMERTMSRHLSERCSIALKFSVEAMQQDIQGTPL